MTTGARFAEVASRDYVTRERASPKSMEELALQLRRRGAEAGMAAVGIAPATAMATTRLVLEERKAAGLSGGMQFTYRNPARSTEPGRILTGAAALVVGAWPYGETPRDRPTGDGAAGVAPAESHGFWGRPRGRVARYARRDHYRDLRDALGQVAEVLKAAGWRATVVADDNALVDRAAAERAGLGWFGKNTNILLPGRGSWFLLGSVVTDAPLAPGRPAGDGCGSCRRCLISCPTGALVAPGVLDARKCLAWLLQAPGVFPFEYRAPLEGRIYGCDDCQEVCPANRLTARIGGRNGGSSTNAGAQDKGVTERQGEPEGQGEPEVDLLELLAASDEWLLARYGRWYIPQRDPRYLRRNALIALANVADGSQPEVGQALARYLDDADELLRAHAVWAAFRAGRPDLVASRPSLAADPSPLVHDELARRPEVPVRQGGGG
jgi:epoxyqueuosine reductase